MSTKVNVEILNVLRQRLDTRALVILKEVDRTAGNPNNVVILETLEDLTKNFQAKEGGNPAAPTLESRHELAQVEYLLEQGIPVVAMLVDANVVTELREIVADNDGLYNIRVATYPSEKTPTTLGAIFEELKGTTIELHLNVDSTAITTLEGQVKGRNASFFTGEALLGRASSYSDDEGNTYILASVAAQGRKVRLIDNKTPYIPIAGETHGVFPEFINVKKRLTRKEKEEFQSARINPLITKLGVGVHFVAQNTRHITASEKTDPLLRAHANTLTNYLVDVFTEMGDKYHFEPNNQRAWDLFSLEANKLLRNLVSEDGIEAFSVLTGRRLMTNTDIAEGKFKAQINFLPVRVIEAVQLNLIVQDDFETIVNIVEGDEE